MDDSVGDFPKGDILIDDGVIVRVASHIDADDAEWSMNAAGPEDARYAIIYNDSDVTTPKAAIGYMDLGGDVSLRQGDITLKWAGTGIHRFTYEDLS